MTMNDSELTKKAIEELLKDMNDGKEKDGLPTERKKNPLGKPNKRFLGRTINSMMKHNKRQSDSNYRRCQRKLRELDAKQKKRGRKQTRKNREEIQRRSQTESSHEDISSDSERLKEKKHKNLKKIKRKKKKKKSSSSSSSNSSTSSSSSETESSCSTIPSKVKKYKNSKTNKRSGYSDNEENKEFYSEITQQEPSVGYYIDPHMAYAAMAYGHINHVLQQQQLVQQQTIKHELEESVEIPSDLSISYHSESSLNISLHSSSAEEDENGILTFKLLSTDEERESLNSKKINSKRNASENHNIVTLVDSDGTDQNSVKSYISLESTTSQMPNRQTNEILLLSSSTSDCDDLELIDTISESKLEESNFENNVEKLDNALVELETKNNIDEIENSSNTNEDSILEKQKEAEIETQSAEINKELEEEETVQVDEPVNENQMKKILEIAEESDKDIDVSRDHNGKIIDENKELNTNKTEMLENYTNTKTIESEKLEDYKGEITDTNIELNKNKSRMPENHTNTTIIDLTEE